MQRAEDKTAAMQAGRVRSTSCWLPDALDDPTGIAKDDITVELDRLASNRRCRARLARMKQELTAGSWWSTARTGRAAPKPFLAAGRAVSDPIAAPDTQSRQEEGRPLIVRIMGEGRSDRGRAGPEFNTLDDA